ncbi:lantibiotic biosynthesis dehydratase-like protein [Streptomyces sp. TLI_235]|nr:lantibiotic dehydratase [Streptomyces sp. TLI_235]PBC75545.1 lantibiotic biosynthesis dehydratase-like protein [Streptomyces sp. TLI_235]
MSAAALRREAAPAALAGHQLALAGGEFALWRTCSLRGAGMPVDWIDALADDALWQRTLDHLAAAEASAARQPAPGRAGKAERAAARQEQQQRDAAYRAGFAEAVLRQAAAVQEFARRPLVREAVAWQNPRFAGDALESFCRAADPGGRNSRWRQREKTVVGYLQRYCTKNDTIGFFGPVGWAELSEERVPLAVDPGRGLLAERTVYWESWGIDLLGEALTERHGLRPHVPPRRNPSVHVDGDTVLRPYRRALELPPAQAAVLRACDGRASAREIAEELTWLGAPGLTTEQDVYAALERLVRQGVVTWDLDVPFGRDPASGLREMLARMPAGPARDTALAELGEVERLRGRVAAAGGDPAAVLGALTDLARDFTERTGQVASRRAGETGAGRTLLFEDARRAATARLGGDLLADIGPALDQVLRSARWFTAAVADGYRAELDTLYDQAVRDAGSPRIPLSTLTFLLGPRLVGDGAKPTDELAGELRARWDRVLGHPAEGSRRNLSSADLADAVAEEFGCDAPGWTAARYHSPDLLIAAPDAASVRPGETLVVLGELHTALNTLEGRLFVEQHPDPASLWDMVRADGVLPRIVPMLPKSWRAVGSRTYPPLTMLLPEYTYWSPGQDSGGAPGEVLPAAGLQVHREDGRLVVTARTGPFRADLIEVLGELISMVTVTRFGILPTRDHTPRVTVDRLVLARETWRPAAGELLVPAKADEATEYLETVRWLTEHGVPRRFFLVAPVEEKPTYIDTRSPLLVQLLARTVRRTAEQCGPDTRITVSEMLPDGDDCWLRDEHGQRYVSELRVVAVDRRLPEAARNEGEQES